MLLSTCTTRLNLQEGTRIDGQMSKAGKLDVWETYLSEIKSKTYYQWEQELDHHIVIVKTHTIVHPYLYNTAVLMRSIVEMCSPSCLTGIEVSHIINKIM